MGARTPNARVNSVAVTSGERRWDVKLVFSSGSLLIAFSGHGPAATGIEVSDNTLKLASETMGHIVLRVRDLLAKWWSSSRLETRTGESFVYASQKVLKPYGVIKVKVILLRWHSSLRRPHRPAL